MNLLLTACGCPGASTLIRYLRKAYSDIQIIGTDMRDNVIGKILSDKFYVVPPGNDKFYIQSILKIAEEENVEVILPESTIETVALSKEQEKILLKGIIPIVSNYKVLKIAINKYKLYERLKGKVPLPKYIFAESLEEFNRAVYKLGYPKTEVCFKPPVSEGSRGFRIVSPGMDRKHYLLYEKPTSKYITLDEVNDIFSNGKFTPLLVMEFVEGEALDAMTIAFNREALLTTIKTRERERGGVITYGGLVERPVTKKLVEKIIHNVPLKYSVGLQFIDNKLIEINPRVSTFIFQDDLIEIYYSIELARGRINTKEVEKKRKKVMYGRKMIRYMDQVSFNG
jgi:carbamoyl-phosphate synthase large subunit